MGEFRGRQDRLEHRMRRGGGICVQNGLRIGLRIGPRNGLQNGWRIKKRIGDPPREDVVATDGQEIGKQLQNRIVQLETELAELKGNLVHGSANAGRLIGGLLAADGRLEKSVEELKRLMDWAMDMGD